MAFIHGPVAESFEREVAATLREFERDLRQAWPGGVECSGDGRYRISDGTLVLDIEAHATGTRRLGPLELPQLSARYRFAGGDEAARRRLLARLDRAMQRGGG